jgi:hypothetical protein
MGGVTKHTPRSQDRLSRAETASGPMTRAVLARAMVVSS